MSLSPGRHNFSIWQGATFHVSLDILTNGKPWKELEEYSALMEIRDVPKATVPLFTLSTTNGRIFIEENVITLRITASDTTAIKWESGVYDLLITAPGGDTDALLYGSVKVKGI